jgi:hypothetical protein
MSVAQARHSSKEQLTKLLAQLLKASGLDGGAQRTMELEIGSHTQLCPFPIM